MQDNLRTVFEGLAAKNPDLKEYGYDNFANDMKDEAKLKQVYNGLSAKNADQFKNYDFNLFKADMIGTQTNPSIDEQTSNTQDGLGNNIYSLSESISSQKQKLGDEIYKIGKTGERNAIESVKNIFRSDKNDVQLQDYEGDNEITPTSVKTKPMWEEYKKLEQAEDLLTKAEEYKKAPSQNSFNAFLKGLNAPLAKDLLSAGLTEVERNLQVAKSITGDTDADQQLIAAYKALKKIQENPDGETGWTYQTGEVVSNMIPYMIQFALTRGGGTAAKASVNEILKTAGSKGVSAIAKKGAAYTAGAMGQAVSMPMMYGKFGEEIAGGKDYGNAFLSAFMKTTGETFGERFGEVGSKLLTKTLAKNAGSIRSNLMKAVGWNGPWEYLEENVTNAWNTLFTDERELKDFWNWKEQGVIALSTMIVGGPFALHNHVVKSNVKNSLRKAEDKIDGISDESLRNQIIGAVDVESPENTMNNIGELIRQNNITDKSLLSDIGNYAKSRIQYNAMFQGKDQPQVPTVPPNSTQGINPEVQAVIDRERGIYEGLLNEQDNDQNKPMYQQRLDQITNDPQGYFTEALQRMEALYKNYPTQERQERINKLKGILSQVQPQAPADPMQQVRKQLDDEFNAGVHKETGNNVWVNHAKLGSIRLSSADIDQAGNIVSKTGEVFAWDPNSPKNQIPILLTEIIGKPVVVSRDQYLSDALQKVQTVEAEKAAVDSNSYTDETGQRWMITGQQDEKGNPLVAMVDGNNRPTAQIKPVPQDQLDSYMQKKQVEEAPVPEGEAKPVVENSTWGKTKYQHKSNPDGTTDVLIPNNIPASKAFDEISKHFATNSRYTVVPVKEKKVITDPNDKFADPREVEVTTGVKIVPKEMAPATQDQAQTEDKGTKPTTQSTIPTKQTPAKYSFGKDKIERDEAAEIVNLADSYEDIKDLKLEGDQELQNLIQTKFPPVYLIGDQPTDQVKVRANIRLGKNLDQITIENDSELSNLLAVAKKKFTGSVNKNQKQSGNDPQNKPVTPSQPTSTIIPGEQKSPINESVPEGQSEKNVTPQDIKAKREYIEKIRREELKKSTSGLSRLHVMAADYLLTGGVGSILSSDYLIQGIGGVFTRASYEIDAIRNKYSDAVNKTELADVKNFVGTETYNKIVSEIRDAIKSVYDNNAEINSLFDDVIKNPTGLPVKVGNRVSKRIDEIHSQIESDINDKYDAELEKLKEKEGSDEVGMGTNGKTGAAGKEPGEVTTPEQQPAQEPAKPGSQPQSEPAKDTPDIVTPLEASIEKPTVKEKLTVEKEPWEMTREEFYDAVYNKGYDFQKLGKDKASIQHEVRNYHGTTDPQNKEIAKNSIDAAIKQHYRGDLVLAWRDGKNIPDNVKAENPDLFKQQEKPEQAKVTSGTPMVFDDLDASITVRMITDPRNEMYKLGYRYEGTVSYPESLGEMGSYDEGHYHKELPTLQQLKKDVLQALENEVVLAYETGNKGNGIIALSSREENILKAIYKVAPKLFDKYPDLVKELGINPAQAKPIGIDNQIEDVLLGESEEQKKAVAEKVKYATDNIDRIVSINGSKVYDVTIDNEGKIRYNLRKTGKNTDQKYYYPVQYANIEYSQEQAPVEGPKRSEKLSSWYETFDKLKAENNIEELETFYTKVKIALNGVAQGKDLVKEFEDLKKEIEQYAEEWKAKNKKPEIVTPLEEAVERPAQEPAKPEADENNVFDEDHVSRNLDDYKNEPEKEKALKFIKSNLFDAIGERDILGSTPERVKRIANLTELIKRIDGLRESPKEYRYKMLLRPFDIGTHPKEGFVKVENDPEGGFQILTYDRKLTRKEWDNFSFIPLTEINDVKGKQYEHQDGDYTIDLDWLKNNQWATVTIKDKNGEVMTDPYDMSYMDVLENIETGYWVESKPIEKVEPEIKTPLEDALDNSLAQKNEFVFDHVYRGWKYISSVGKYEAQVTYKNGESSKSTFTIYSSTPFPENQFPRSFKDMATLETYKRDLLYDETPAIPPADQEQKPPSPPKKPQKKSFTDQVKKGLSENDGNRLDELRNKLRNKLGGQLNVGLDPETFILAAEATGLVIKSGARQFKDFVASMVEMLGNEIKPFLKGLYEYSRRADSSQFASEMTPTNDVDNSDIDVILQQLEDNSVDNNKDEEDVFDRPGDSQQDSPDTEDSPSDAGDIRGNRGGGRGGRGTNAKGGRKGNRKPKGGPGLFDLFPPDGTEQGDQDGDKGGPGDADPGGNGTDGTEGLDDVEGRDDDAGEGSEEVSESFKQRIERVRKEQRKAENIQAKLLDADNIRETLPFLLPEQQDDVIKAETRFFGEAHTKNKDLANGKGMLFTNGTGTGKTYTGLGIIKRFVKMGKGNVLIVVPSQPKVNDWIVDGRNLNLDITALDGIKDGGKGIVITTYANFSQNDELKKRDFDLVIYDESHRLMEEKNGTASARTYAHYDISNRFESDAYNRVRSQNELWKRIVALRKEIYQRNKDLNANMDLPREEFVAQANEIKKLEEREEKLTEQFDENVKPGLKERAKEAYQNTKVVFLSATPFKSHFNLRYSNGILFDWGNNDGGRVSAESKFFLDNFGAAYEWKYNQLQVRSRPDADAVAMNEVEFSEKLMSQGVMSGRAIESPMDYERSFPLVSGFNSELFNRALSEIFDYSTNQFDSLRNVATTVFHNYNYSTQLFESLKASMSIDRMKAHLDMGRKVVVFHRRQQANVEPPFESILRSVKSTAENTLRDPEAYESEKEKAQRTLNQVALFAEKYSQLLEYEQTLDYRSAINQIKSEFGNRVAFVNGTVSTKEKNKAIHDFNKDDSGIDIIVVQEEAGKEGISLHDTTGNHQRVIMSLSMPNSSTTALQIEGRIYRIGNASDAIFEYPLLGLDMEINYFGQNINKRLSTTENLAIGNSARDLIRSFAEGVLFNSSTDVPSINQGKGGKEYDKAERSIQSDFQKAILVYRSNQKTRGKRDQREGIDYFATPEPIGQKMVEWLDLRSEDAVLEPSAGHGAIAMWFPNNVALTATEPSFSLFSRLNARAGGGTKRIINNTFESLDIVNKYNGIAMNPPFGTGGKTAMDHVEKAFLHLKNGGRLIAIVPAGPSMDKRVDKFFNEEDENGKLKRPEARLVATIELPGVTFEQAGTNVMSKILVIDRVDARTEFSFREEVQVENRGRLLTDRGSVLMTPSEIAAEARKRFEAYRNSFSSPRNINLSYIKGINELFEAIEGIGIDKRNIPESEPSVTPQRPASNQMAESSEMDVFEQNNTRTGEKLYMANFKKYVTRDGYLRANKMAEKYGGYFSKYENKAQKVRKGFLFKTEKDRADFLNEYSEGQDFNPMQRVVSTIGYYSTVEDALDKITQGKGTPEQFKAMLLKNGAKQAEMDWMDFDETFSGKKSVTKADIQEWIDQNKIEVEEVVKESISEKDGMVDWNSMTDEAQERINELDAIQKRWERYIWQEQAGDELTDRQKEQLEEWEDEFGNEDGIFEEMQSIRDDSDNYEVLVSGGDTKFSQYTTPGGENYKELLLTMPSRRGTKEDYAILMFGKNYDELSYNEQGSVNRSFSTTKEQDFKSSHWDESNILAHIRFDERVTTEGEKVLFIEEIQSDFSQSLKKKRDEYNKLLKNNPDLLIDMFKKSNKLEVLC